MQYRWPALPLLQSWCRTTTSSAHSRSTGTIDGSVLELQDQGLEKPRCECTALASCHIRNVPVYTWSISSLRDAVHQSRSKGSERKIPRTHTDSIGLANFNAAAAAAAAQSGLCDFGINLSVRPYFCITPNFVRYYTPIQQPRYKKRAHRRCRKAIRI